MSTNNMVKSISIVAFGFVAGYVGMHYLSQRTQLQSASYASKAKNPIHMGKQHLLTSVKIQTPENMPQVDTEEVTLIGYVTLHQPTDRPLYWEWILPNGVTVVKGDAKDYEANPVPGKTYLTEITVTGFSKEEKKTLTLQGYIETDSARSGNSYVVSSDPESSFEYIAPELKSEVDADREIASQDEGGLKQKAIRSKPRTKQIQF